MIFIFVLFSVIKWFWCITFIADDGDIIDSITNNKIEEASSSSNNSSNCCCCTFDVAVQVDMKWYVLNVFLVTAIAGSIYDTIDIIVENPGSAFEMIENSLLCMSSFLITLVTTKTFMGLGADLICCLSIVQSMIRFTLLRNAMLKRRRYQWLHYVMPFPLLIVDGGGKFWLGQKKRYSSMPHPPHLNDRIHLR